MFMVILLGRFKDFIAKTSGQKRLTVGVTGGGAGETPQLLSRHFWQNSPARERRSRCLLEPVLGGA